MTPKRLGLIPVVPGLSEWIQLNREIGRRVKVTFEKLDKIAMRHTYNEMALIVQKERVICLTKYFRRLKMND